MRDEEVRASDASFEAVRAGRGQRKWPRMDRGGKDTREEWRARLETPGLRGAAGRERAPALPASPPLARGCLAQATPARGSAATTRANSPGAGITRIRPGALSKT
eukprot:4773153-Pyramimonas_sp.AAC.1